jgi:hypothetical protein
MGICSKWACHLSWWTRTEKTAKGSQCGVARFGRHRPYPYVKYGVGSPKYNCAPCHVMYTAVLMGWDPELPPSPALGLVYEKLMVSRDRRHLFITPDHTKRHEKELEKIKSGGYSCLRNFCSMGTWYCSILLSCLFRIMSIVLYMQYSIQDIGV